MIQPVPAGAIARRVGIAVLVVGVLWGGGCAHGSPREAGVWHVVELAGGDAAPLTLNLAETELRIGQGRDGGFDLAVSSGRSHPDPELDGCVQVAGRARRATGRLRLVERFEIPAIGCTVIEVPAAEALADALLVGVGWELTSDDRLVVTTDDGLVYTFAEAQDVTG